MPSILARGQSLLNRKALTTTDETVRVLRAETVLCDEWSATPGELRIESFTEGQQTVVANVRDWLGAPGQWLVSGAAVEPERGDLIYWTSDDREYCYEVMPAGGDDSMAPSGRFENRMRVHTKLIGSEAVEGE